MKKFVAALLVLMLCLTVFTACTSSTPEAKTTEAPVEATEAPVEATEAPAEETEAPAEETEAPAEETEAPAEETEAPVEKEAEAPAEETEAPAEETEAPAEETEAPAEETEAPAEETEAPAEETEAPAEETEAPAEETEAPAEETEALVEKEAEAPAEETEAPAEETEAPAEEVADEAPAAETESGDKAVIITGIADDPEQMDPTLNSYARSSRVLQNLFKGLYKLDANGMDYVPAMAEGCEISEDGLTYTFTLKDGLKWSDGSDLTAYDFEYSWMRVIDPNVASKCVSDLWVIKNAEAYYNGECTAEEVGIKAEDEKTFVVTLANPTPWFLKLTATTSYFPVCKAIVSENDTWTSDVATYVSNGPFMLTEFSSLNRLVLTKNPNYYMADSVAIDEVQFVIIPDAATELTAYKNGEINVSTNLGSDAIVEFGSSSEFVSSPKIGIQYCDFNCQLPEFSDKRVRQAFSMAIDRQAILTALGYVEKPLYGFVPYAQPSLSQSGKTYREVAGDMFTEDVEAAKALMAEAGYPNGEGFPVVNLVTKNDVSQKLMAQLLGEFWKQNLGVEYTITTYESSVYWDELANGNFSVDRNGFTCDYADPSANLKIWITGSNASENGWDDETYDKMYRDTESMLDDTEREAALIEAEKYLVAQMPAAPIYSFENQYLVKPEISGVICNAIGHIYFEYATIGA